MFYHLLPHMLYYHAYSLELTGPLSSRLLLMLSVKKMKVTLLEKPSLSM
jgi:hypothetical protein